MKSIRKFGIGGLLFLISAFVPTMAPAIPTADILYLEEDLGGYWRYNYTVYNNSDPVADVGVGLFDVNFDFDPVFTLISVLVPTGWDYFDGAGEVGVTTSFVNPFANEEEQYIAPGNALAGFVFEFDAQVGNLEFYVYFANPSGGDSFLDTGTTAPVPEPATLLLMMSGLAGVGVVGRKRRRKSKG